MSGLRFTSDIKSAKRISSDIKNYLSASERATSIAVRKETLRLKNALRSDVKSAGLGNRLANTWRSKTYPEGGRVSMNASGFVYSKAPEIIQSFDNGSTIRARGSRYMAIATENVPKRAGFRGKRLTPKNWPERLGKLRVVRTKNGKLLLVAERQASYTREGQFKNFRKASAKSLRTGIKLTTIVMFILVPQVRLRKRLNVKKQFEITVRRLPDTLLREKQKILR